MFKIFWFSVWMLQKTASEFWSFMLAIGNVCANQIECVGD